MSRKSSKPWPLVLLLLGIIGLPALLLLLLKKKKSPQQVIMETLMRLGISEPTAKMWVAVSAHETAAKDSNGAWVPWTSKVFRDSNNLMCIIVPKSRRLPYGEGQTIFDSIELSIDGPEGLYQRVLKPYKYPAHVDSIDDLVTFMKSKNYFTSDKAKYLTGVKTWYQKLFPNG